MKKLSLKNIQNEELELLKIFVKICNKHSLKYYLAAGTLLGAVRHKGFIPWDDDIDVCMPRKDYNKLNELIKNNNIKLTNNFCFFSKELNNYFCPFIKLVNKKIVTNIEEKNRQDKYLWIDIFPLDGLPNNKHKTKKFINKMFIIAHLYSVKYTSVKNIIKNTHTKKAIMIKLLAKTFTLFISSKKLVYSLINNTQKYNYDTSKYISNTIWLSEQKQYYSKKLFEKEIELSFEDIKVKAFEGYDTYLKQNYGDYMKLPPKNKRYCHSFTAYKLEKTDENDNLI